MAGDLPRGEAIEPAPAPWEDDVVEGRGCVALPGGVDDLPRVTLDMRASALTDGVQSDHECPPDEAL